jgi:hypothetical protein
MIGRLSDEIVRSFDPFISDVEAIFSGAPCQPADYSMAPGLADLIELPQRSLNKTAGRPHHDIA